MKKAIDFVALLLAAVLSVAGQPAQVNAGEAILPADWNPKLAADLVMANLIKVTSQLLSSLLLLNSHFLTSLFSVG
ncbi:hypothetical protein RT717_00255 [Imperialibacter roseus]|uniref:Uncharacterized protein n=1 Tax=Imperialibacter roseus TaxID=1324217 RepID=A0ABZ0IQQ7_9BACT|nr:hypothetical protein [Imperialibacter roseus]WOK07051.1 hypothetical protein RT717_00255 [Imperialibacter roseus]